MGIIVAMFDVDLGAHSDMVVECTRLRAPYGLLVQLLGAPSTDLPEKCSTLWSFREIGAHENVVYLQDFRDEDDRTFKLSEFRALPAFDWDVWAETDEIATRFCDWLSKRVIAKASEVKTLSTESRAALNALLAEGVPMSDALKRVPMQSASQIAARFAWPIR